jgi:transposase
MKTKDARNLSPEAQEAVRLSCVQAVLDGMKQQDAAKTFGVSCPTVSLWMKAYREGGWDALKTQARGRPKGRGAKLRPSQIAKVRNLIRERCPDQLKVPFYLWTREAVAILLRDRFGVVLSLSQIGRYLKSWGFTPQKPLKRAYERDEQKVREWLETEYPKIAAKAQESSGEIYWGDEMGLRSDHQTGTSWAEKGHTPVIKTTSKRFGCNMISAITNRGTLCFRVFDGKFDSRLFIDFLQRLIRGTKRKVFLIVDSHPVHRSKKVKAWIGKHDADIEVFFLPPYSPELNPDELLNQDVKSNAVGPSTRRLRRSF